MSSNYCVCCGDDIPEGRMICKICELWAFKDEEDDEDETEEND